MKTISVEAYVFLDWPAKFSMPVLLPVLSQPYADRDTVRKASCSYCGGEGGTVDHFTPLSHNGPDHISNMVPACQSCNEDKRARHPLHWLHTLLIREDSRFERTCSLFSAEDVQATLSRVPRATWTPYNVWPVD